MLNFSLIYLKKDSFEDHVNHDVLIEGGKYLVKDKSKIDVNQYEFSKYKLFLYSSNSRYQKKKKCILENESSINFYTGWFLRGGGGCNNILSNLDIDIDTKINGQYLFARINKDGSGFVRRDKIGCVIVYYYEDKNIQFFSTSLGMMFDSIKELSSKGIKNCLSDEYISRKVLTQHAILGSFTPIKDIYTLDPGDNISLSAEGVEILSNKSTYNNQYLKDLYQNNKKLFYDKACEDLKSLLNVVKSLDCEVTLDLSGGKDSRLLLALFLSDDSIKEKLRVFSYGAENSPDMIVAKKIIEKFKLNSEFKNLYCLNIG